MKRLISAIFLILVMSQQASAAACSVSEFSTLITEFSGRSIQIAVLTDPSPTTQIVTATSATAVSNAFSSGTRFLWIYCDELMHIQIGTTPATGLTTGDMRIPAGGFWVGLPLNAVNLGTLKIAFCDADCA